VRAVTLSGVKGGNIILDLVFRSANEMTLSDAAELYGVDADSDQAANLLKSLTGKDRQILELNPSYGAQGLFLFQTFEINKTASNVDSIIGKIDS
jgi:hypothetical protein